MFRVDFKNLEKSSLAVSAVEERLSPILDRFPTVDLEKIRITLSMDNSPTQAGPDLFKVKIHVTHGPLRGLILQKSAANLYLALNDVSEKLHERIHRITDKKRKVKRQQKRKYKKKSLTNRPDLMTSA